MFAILFEVVLIENQEEIHHVAGLGGGGGKGHRNCDQNFCDQTGGRFLLPLSNFGKKKKRAQTQTFGSGYLAVGVFHVNSRGAKSSVCLRNPGKTNFWAGHPGDFCRDITGASEKLSKTKFVFNFWALNLRPHRPATE